MVGDDYLDGGEGRNVLDGGAGNDTIDGTKSTASGGLISAGSVGAAPAFQYDGEILRGGLGDDIIFGGGNATIDGGPGNDYIDAGRQSGAWSGFGFGVYGGAGNDIMLNGRVLFGGAGDDFLYGMDDLSSTLYGEDGDDMLVLGAAGGLANGGDGSDSVTGSDAGDDIWAEAGNDYVEGLGGTDALYGGDGDDQLIGGEGGDVLQGDAGAPGKSFAEINALTGDDVLDGGSGRDNLVGGHGDDQLFGGEGDDVLLGDNIDATFTRWNFAFAPTATGETLTGTVYDDFILAYGGADTLLGNGGNDELHGGTGDDTLRGGAGNDYLAGDEGDDTYLFDAGDGRDTLRDLHGTNVLVFDVDRSEVSFSRTESALLIEYGAGDSILVLDAFAGASPTLIDRYEFASGAPLSHGDMLAALPAEPVTYTGPVLNASAGLLTLTRPVYELDVQGDDALEGGDGNDFLRGFAGDDQLSGDAGNDDLIGNRGSDTLVGGTGNDRLDGGEDDDTYEFAAGDGRDTLVDASGNDTIVFAPGILAANVNAYRTVRDGVEYLIVEYGAGDSIAIENGASGITETYAFDGATLTHAQLMANVPSGTLTYSEEIRASSPLDGYTHRLLNNSGIFYEGENGADRIVSLSGSDQIEGYLGDDLIDAGAGDDLLFGGGGNDIYVFGRGYGKDLINEVFNRGFPAGTAYEILIANDPADVIRFDDSVAVTDVSVARGQQYDQLVFSLAGSDDTLTVHLFFSPQYPVAQIERVEFADGTAWDLETIIAQSLLGSSQPDVLIGIGTDDFIRGLEGADVLDGAGGNDTLTGGLGDDVLRGGLGDDIFVFDSGDGADTLDDAGGIDTIRFGAGITPTDIRLRTDFRDLVVEYSSGSVRVIGGADRRIEWYEFAGEVDPLSHEDLLLLQGRLELTGGSGADYLLGSEDADLLDGGGSPAGQSDLLVGRAGDDEYVFNLGYGRVEIFDLAGFDTLRFGRRTQRRALQRG